MLGLFPASQSIKDIDCAAYPGRSVAGVQALAESCGLDPEREAARFVACRRVFGADETGNQGGALGMASQLLGKSLPVVFELIVTCDGERPRGFGYLTQGAVVGSLPDNLAALVAGGLRLHLENGGALEEGALLADLFRLAFPDLNALADFSPLAQGLLIGAVTGQGSIRLKAYLHTRLFPAAGHRERVAGMLSRCGLEGIDFYDLLYCEEDEASFQGVGVDLDGSRRAKLYVRLPRRYVVRAAERLAPHIGGAVVEPMQELLARMDGSEVADEVELAVALASDRQPTVKMTVFFPGTTVSRSDWERVAAYLQHLGHDPLPLEPALQALGEGTPAGAQKHPLRAVGIEVPAAERVKANVYLQAVL